MNLRLELNSDAIEYVALFAQATNAGMFSTNEAISGAGVVDESDPHCAVLTLSGVDPESLLGLLRMLTAARLPMPVQMRGMALQRGDPPLEERLRADLRNLVSVEGVGELSGEALFMSVRSLSAASLYETVIPIVALWEQLLVRQVFPYERNDSGVASTDGVEVYEISDEAVELATRSYSGAEEGIAALVHGTATQLQRAGVVFYITCWTA